jgi:cytochrome b involved in lipid metabolism
LNLRWKLGPQFIYLTTFTRDNYAVSKNHHHQAVSATFLSRYWITDLSRLVTPWNTFLGHLVVMVMLRMVTMMMMMMMMMMMTMMAMMMMQGQRQITVEDWVNNYDEYTSG